MPARALPMSSINLGQLNIHCEKVQEFGLRVQWCTQTIPLRRPCTSNPRQTTESIPITHFPAHLCIASYIVGGLTMTRVQDAGSSSFFLVRMEHRSSTLSPMGKRGQMRPAEECQRRPTPDHFSPHHNSEGTEPCIHRDGFMEPHRGEGDRADRNEIVV
jgi:hypothetical protein